VAAGPVEGEPDERTAIVMINTNFLSRWRARTGQRRLIPARRGGLAGEEGLTLIEVMVSALMVGFIAIATFNGFDVANRATADERFHDQAAQLASQAQELLRSDSAKTLDRLEEASSHSYTETIGGETYTITQSDRWISDANQNASCSATGEEHSSQAGNYLQIHTEITWPQQLAASEKPLEQYSIVTPPDGSGLEVDVLSGRTPEQPVSGVTVIAGEGTTSSTATTSEAGCVIFGGIPATRVNIESFKIGDVTESGAIKKFDPEVLVAPNITTHVPVILNRGAAVTAEFTHEGNPATGDTFVAASSKLKPAPYFELGSTRFGAFGKEGEYDAEPGEIEASPGKSYAATATTPISATYYPTGDLFPFEAPWSVYAGDCTENNPEVADPSQFPKNSDPSVALEPGQNPTVKIPTSELTLDVYKAKKSTLGGGGLASAIFPVKITNTGCQKVKEEEEKNKKTYIPDNASQYSLVHTQDTTAGHLEAPYQPFGKSFKLCLYNATTKYKFTTTYGNEKTASPAIELFMEEKSNYTDANGHSIEVTSASTNTC
jgi:type II secretory pathway pseudopilin PulG